MLVNCFPPCSTQTFSSQPFQRTLIPVSNQHRCQRNPSASPTFVCRLGVGFEDVAAITQNKVLLAATLSTAVGQLSKPFTSYLFYGNDFNLKSAVQSGGFPSTHSSAVVATATCLGLERGFSDAIFGLAVVYAALFMYDAQGVRREVGKHARTINSIILENQATSKVEESRSTSVTNAVESTSSSSRQVLEIDTVGNKVYSSLFERVGHTEVEVVGGAILGALVSLTLYAVA